MVACKQEQIPVIDISKAELDAEIMQLKAHLSTVSPKTRKIGIAKGELTAAFFEPLPDDELNTWER